jgi:AraC-like DNA-binding protein
MELEYKIVDQLPECSFHARRETVPYVENHWHYHKDYELIYFHKSSGIRYIGNTIGRFSSGEIYLTGSSLPHLFKNKTVSPAGSSRDDVVDMIIIHFKEDFLGSQFMNLPESRNLKALLQRSLSGLKYSRVTSSVLHNYIMGIPDNKGLSGLANLILTLDVLSYSRDYIEICPRLIPDQYRRNEKEQMAKVVNYMLANYKKRISLEEIAEVASMTPGAFCRFFSNKTNKSFTEYLNEIRIGNACKMLIEGEIPVSEICYSMGFNTLSNFNRRFKKVMGVTPTEYIKAFSEKSK